MVAMSSLRFLATSSSFLCQPRRLQSAGGLAAIPVLRVAASASPALHHARRLSYASDVGASLRVVAQATPAARPQRLSSALFPFPGSIRTAAAHGLQVRCFPTRQGEGADDPSKEGLELPQSPTTPGMPGHGPLVSALSSETSKRPVVHLMAVLLLSGVKNPEFRRFVEAAGTRYKFPTKVTVGILLGAAVISVLFDAAVMGKEVNEVCSYLLTHRQKVEKDDR